MTFYKLTDAQNPHDSGRQDQPYQRLPLYVPLPPSQDPSQPPQNQVETIDELVDTGANQRRGTYINFEIDCVYENDVRCVDFRDEFVIN